MLIKQGGLDPAQRLGDGDVLLLQAFEPPMRCATVRLTPSSL